MKFSTSANYILEIYIYKIPNVDKEAFYVIYDMEDKKINSREDVKSIINNKSILICKRSNFFFLIFKSNLCYQLSVPKLIRLCIIIRLIAPQCKETNLYTSIYS